MVPVSQGSTICATRMGFVSVSVMKLTKDDIERICGSECSLEEFKQILSNQKLREQIEELVNHGSFKFWNASYFREVLIEMIKQNKKN